MSSAERWLLRDVSVDGRRVDCLIADGRIADIATSIDAAGARVLDAAGAALLPGLADHHVHLLATAAAEQSLDLAGSSDLAPIARWPGAGWIRVISAGQAFERTDIDRIESERPVRVQHRSGALWTLNSPAVEQAATALTPEERSTGQLWRADERLRVALGEQTRPDVAELGRRLAAWGITHLTDATPTPFGGELDVPQHLLTMHAEGKGPRKIILADHDLPAPDAVTATVREAHCNGRPVAVHAISAAALAIAIAAIESAGPMPGDRIEHAAMCDDGAADRIAELGLTVVTQPSIFVRHSNSFLAETEPDERRWLWRYGTLLDRGVRVVMSSDAPYGDANPWIGIRAAAAREGPERVTPATALTSLLADPRDLAGSRRSVHVGAPADLCLLTSTLDDILVDSGDAPVWITFMSGRAAYTKPR